MATIKYLCQVCGGKEIEVNPNIKVGVGESISIPAEVPGITVVEWDYTGEKPKQILHMQICAECFSKALLSIFRKGIA